jgi:hypothetical protein
MLYSCTTITLDLPPTYHYPALTECTDVRHGGNGEAPHLSKLLHLAGYWNVTWVSWTEPVFAKCPFSNACTDNSSLRPLHADDEERRYAYDKYNVTAVEFDHFDEDQSGQDGANWTSNKTESGPEIVQMTNCVPTTGGPLCAVCNKGYYRANRTMAGCIRCTGNTTPARVGILCLVVYCILMLIYACR